MATPQPEARRRPQQLGAGRQSPLQGLANPSPRPLERALPPPTSARFAPGARRAGSEAPGGARARPPGSPRRRGPRRGESPARRGPASGRAPARPARRARCARRAGRPARRCAPRHGSRGSGASRRRPARRSAPHRGSRVPWRPSECPPGPRTAPARSAAGSRHGLPRARGGIGVQPEDRERRHGFVQQAGQALRPGAIAREGDRAACWTGLGDGLAVAAVVAHEGARCRLWRTSETSQCGHSQARPQDRQQKNGDQPRRLSRTIALARRLADLGQRLPDARVERAGDGSGPPAGIDSWRPSTTSTCGRSRPSARRGSRSRGRPSQLSGRGVALPATSARSGFGRPPPGDLAGVVARIALLLVGGVVLLVDHHQAQVAHRGEGRRARPDADPRFAGLQALPLVAALARGQPGVEQRDAVAEPRHEPRHRLRRQPDLRDEHDRAPAPPKRRLGGRQVDLGLARARHPVEEVLAGRGAVDRGDDRVERRPLLGRQPRSRSTGRRRPRPPAAGSCGRCAA